MKFTRKRKMEKVINFVFTKRYMFLLGILDEYEDKDEDRLKDEIIEILRNARIDQSLRVLSYLICVCCAHDSFNVAGMEKELKFVNDALGPDE